MAFLEAGSGSGEKGELRGQDSQSRGCSAQDLKNSVQRWGEENSVKHWKPLDGGVFCSLHS